MEPKAEPVDSVSPDGAPPGRPRNLVVCLDGTGNTVRTSRNSNVLRLFDLLDFSDERQQIAYYDPGVGTFSALGAWTPLGRRISRLSGLAVGTGLRHNLGEAYLFLVQNWQPGDQLYFFGFSRGAYAARALAGLVHTIGMLHPHEENLLPYAISAYARRWRPPQHAPDGDGHPATPSARPGSSVGEDQADLKKRFRDSFARRRGAPGPWEVRVRYLGLWDTVEASGHLRRDLGWPCIKTLPNADAVRHAISIDEKRWPYRVVPVEGPADPRREEVWFPGVHSDVGGTFPDPPEPGRLSDVTLAWVLEGAAREGLLVDEQACAVECRMTRQHMAAPINPNAWPWRPVSWATRPLGDNLVHASARDRGPHGRRPALTGRPSYADADRWPPSD